MCDFKPGDEVMFVSEPLMYGPNLDYSPPSGSFICVEVGDNPADLCKTCGSSAWVVLDRIAWPACPCVLRKVQRRDLQSWLNTSVPNTDHLDKPLPAKKRERV